MKQSHLINQIVYELGKTDAERRILSPYTAVPFAGNELFFFLKPEITSLSSEHLAEALEAVFERFERYRIMPCGISIIGDGYLKRHRLIEAHYGMINRVANEGRRVLPSGAWPIFEREYGRPAETAEILGAFEFLSRFPDYTPSSLRELWAKYSSVKLAGGAYSVRLTPDDLSGRISDDLWLLNGFHPKQIEHFTAPGRSIATFVLRSETAWKTLRGEMLGVTAPFEAVPGSLRRFFWDERERLGITEINYSNNGAHLSAGPLESIAEIRRFLSDDERGGKLDLAEIAASHYFLDRKIGYERLESLIRNEPISPSGVFPFDLTEECDTIPSAEMLVKTLP